MRGNPVRANCCRFGGLWLKHHSFIGLHHSQVSFGRTMNFKRKQLSMVGPFCPNSGQRAPNLILLTRVLLLISETDSWLVSLSSVFLCPKNGIPCTSAKTQSHMENTRAHSVPLSPKKGPVPMLRPPCESFRGATFPEHGSRPIRATAVVWKHLAALCECSLPFGQDPSKKIYVQ